MCLKHMRFCLMLMPVRLGEDMLIEIEKTYNSNVRNFYLGTNILPFGFAEYADLKTKTLSAFAQSILKIEGVLSVLILPDMVSVLKKENADFKILEPQIMAEIVDYDFSKFEDFNFSAQDTKGLIQALVEAKIRPFLKNDGGDIEVLTLKDGVLYVRLQGRCKGCPHAGQTLKNTVEAILRKYILAIQSVQEESLR